MVDSLNILKALQSTGGFQVLLIIFSKNEIIVADSGNKRIQIFNKDTTFRSKFDTLGNTPLLE